jgi:PAS domain S-box-containing protein
MSCNGKPVSEVGPVGASEPPPEAGDGLFQVEAALRRSERKYRELVEHANSIILHWTRDGLITFLNEFGQRFFGYTEAEILGQHVVGTIVPETETTGRDLRPLMDHICANPHAFERNVNENMRRNGERVWIDWTNRFSLDDQGQVTGILSIGSDITEHRRTEEALRESEAGFRAMFEVACIGIAQADLRTGRWLRVNRKMCEITGYSAEEMLNLRIAEITHPADRALDSELFRRLVQGQAPDYRLEKRYLRKGGTVAWVNVNVTVIRDAAGQPLRTMATIEDITERRQAAEEKARLEEQLRQAQKLESVGRLAGGVAHDFNNLLMGMMNHVELCRDELPPGHPARCYLDEITHDAQRSAAITQQLLAFARKQVITPKVLDMNDVLAGMLKMLGHLMGEDIALIWMPGAPLWPVSIDPGQLDQILANLCVNARDAIAGVGRVTIETANTRLDQAYCATQPEAVPGDYVRLAVGDSGCGMSEDVLAHIFEPFYTTKEVGKGTGLGLATVYGIVEQNHGHIAVHSEVGKGTTFHLYLPRAAAAAPAGAVAVAPVALPRGTETILVAEDEKSVRVTSCRFLELLGYTVLAAATPTEALRLAGAHTGPIHLLLTDVIMPGMNGPDLAGLLAEGRPKLKCLFMSGYTADVMMRRGMLGAGRPFLSKPFSRDDLARKVREMLDL